MGRVKHITWNKSLCMRFISIFFFLYQVLYGLTSLWFTHLNEVKYFDIKNFWNLLFNQRNLFIISYKEIIVNLEKIFKMKKNYSNPLSPSCISITFNIFLIIFFFLFYYSFLPFIVVIRKGCLVRRGQGLWKLVPLWMIRMCLRFILHLWRFFCWFKGDFFFFFTVAIVLEIVWEKKS